MDLGQRQLHSRFLAARNPQQPPSTKDTYTRGPLYPFYHHLILRESPVGRNLRLSLECLAHVSAFFYLFAGDLDEIL